MKKPSNRIIDIMVGLPEDPNNLGTFTISFDQRAEVIQLCQVVDKRDQQLRARKRMPEQAKSKAAKRKATKAAARR